MLVILSFDVRGASCVDLVSSEYVNSANTLEQCSNFIVMTATEYNNIKSEEFSMEAYDYGLEGVVRMFVAGIGIGAILAFLAKLRR